MQNIFTIYDLEQLLQAEAASKAFQFAFKELSGEENRSWQIKFARHYRACGCGHGAALGLSTLLVGIAYCLAVWRNAKAVEISISALCLLGLSFIATGLGKALGVYWHRRQLRQAVHLFKQRLVQTGQVCIS